MITFRLSHKHLLQFMKPFDDVWEEGVLYISKEGWLMRTMNPAHTMMWSVRIFPSAFEEYPSDITDTKIGLEFPSLLTFLEFTDKDSEIEISFDKKEYYLRSGNITDRKRIRNHNRIQKPTPPSLTHTGEFLNLPNRDLRTFIHLLNHQSFKGTDMRWNELGDIELQGRDGVETSDLTLEVRGIENTLRLDGDETDPRFVSNYPTELLQHLSLSIGIDETINRIRFAMDYPVEFMILLDGGQIEMKALIAPRVVIE